MKIALQWGAPEQQELAQFVQAVGCGTRQHPFFAEEGLQGQPEVLAAYDEQRLVAIGARFLPRRETPSSPVCRIVIHPDYEVRGIRQPMLKLLQATKTGQTARSASLYA